MGLRREILEELEENENREVVNTNEEDDDKDFHGIAWNILHKKFVEDE